MRRFLAVGEQDSQRAGLPPQQYHALLGIKAGYPGREAITIRELAEHLQIKHHSAVELADRLEASNLVLRQVSPANRRHTVVTLTAAGEKFLHELSRDSLEELRLAVPVIAALGAFLDREWLPQRQRALLARIRDLADDFQSGLRHAAMARADSGNVLKFVHAEPHGDAPESAAHIPESRGDRRPEPKRKAASLAAFSKAFSGW
jgi:DNA-binding MarR family transcriptional regulator